MAPLKLGLEVPVAVINMGIPLLIFISIVYLLFRIQTGDTNPKVIDK